jgi:hypothetical protein
VKELIFGSDPKLNPDPEPKLGGKWDTDPNK